MANQEVKETKEVEKKEGGVAAEITIRNHVIGSIGVGLIPLPIV